MKWLVRIPLALLTLAALVAAGGYLYLRGSLPQLDGSITLDGLSGPVEIIRDRAAIPHIYAATSRDAYFALGFVHAQDRLWQLEMNRRIGSGRLAEIFGAAALDQDKFLRTLGIRRTAAAIYRNLDVTTRARLQAYAAGINAFLDTRRGPLPLEFLIVGVTPEPWTPEDSVAWQLMMAWDLSGNWSQELLRLRLSKQLTNQQIEEFLPPYPGEAALPLPNLKQLYASLATDLAANLDSLAVAAPPALPEGAGSNNWVVAGSRTKSGKPLLANDPHLGLNAPSVWYLAHLDAPDLKTIGATLPGIPAVVLGRNERIAWGFTNTGPDTQDLYVEKIDPANAANYVTPDGVRRFATVEERIKVKDAPDVLLKVRISRHGPVISDAVASISDVVRGISDGIRNTSGAIRSTPDVVRSAALPRSGYVLAFAWTALVDDDRTIAAGDEISRARNWPQFLAAARDFHTPQQNIVYADVDGNIGFIAPARVPIRKPENDLHGLAPAPGWDARYDWAGFIPFEQLPQAFNPADGKIVTANNKIVADDYPYFITSEWAPPYRFNRITALLDAKPKHDLQSFAAMQVDTLSLAARDLLPYLRAAAPTTAAGQQALALMQSWNGRMLADRAEPLIFNAWLRELTRLVYADELGDALFAGAWDQRAPFMTNVLDNRGGAGRWCDDVRTPKVESCADLVTQALDLAMANLRHRYGSHISRWRWGTAHLARSAHRPFSGKPVLGELFDITVPSAGDTYSIDVGRNRIGDELEPYASRHASGLRAIYDLADPDHSLFMQSTGQSGNRLSPYYDDFALPWSKVEYVPMTMQRSEIEKGALGKLLLKPAKEVFTWKSSTFISR